MLVGTIAVASTVLLVSRRIFHPVATAMAPLAAVWVCDAPRAGPTLTDTAPRETQGVRRLSESNATAERIAAVSQAGKFSCSRAGSLRCQRTCRRRSPGCRRAAAPLRSSGGFGCRVACCSCRSRWRWRRARVTAAAARCEPAAPPVSACRSPRGLPSSGRLCTADHSGDTAQHRARRPRRAARRLSGAQCASGIRGEHASRTCSSISVSARRTHNDCLSDRASLPLRCPWMATPGPWVRPEAAGSRTTARRLRWAIGVPPWTAHGHLLPPPGAARRPPVMRLASCCPAAASVARVALMACRLRFRIRFFGFHVQSYKYLILRL